MEAKRPYTVEEINRKVRMVLESGVGEVWVEGEISRFLAHGSGHWYFVLKDERAAVNCAMFARNNRRVGFTPKDGMKVRVWAVPTVYEPAGRFQLVVSRMEEAGKGALRERFEKLKAKLAAEGLFDAARKKPLPLLPRTIGVVTSPSGAAIRDIIRVITRRFPHVRILLAPVPVQGEGAAERIARAIDYLDQRGDVDVMIVGRGGGSIEDLWAFNEEVVARAIARACTPVVSAVGHEIDFTIADFVADVRAATPSAAAERVVPEERTLREEIRRLRQRLERALRARLQALRLRLEQAARHEVFREPRAMVWQYRQRIDLLESRMAAALRSAVRLRRKRLERVRPRLAHRLNTAVERTRGWIEELRRRAAFAAREAVARRRARVERCRASLRALDPLAVLDRGYSLAYRADGTLLRRAADAKIGEPLRLRLAEGEVRAKVTGPESAEAGAP